MAPSAVSAVSVAERPRDVCTIDDSRLPELSGLAADEEHWYAVNDGGTRIEIYVLGKDCAVREVISDPADPYDVEDMALASDGTLWLGDTGDNRKQRDTVALHAVRPDGTATLYRLTYPDGQHDAEALLLDRSGTPYIITKHVAGDSEVYRPAGPLSSPGPTPLEHVGSLRIPATDTRGGPVGRVGSMLITGAASSADGSVIAVRTYTDAYLYPVTGDDIPAALAGQPVRVPLPDEEQGEAIAFEPDGTLLSASEGVGNPVRAVPGATALVGRGLTQGGESQENGESAPEGGEPAAASGGDGGSGFPALAGIAVAVVLAGGVVFGVGRLRRR
ncbi:hypothetical protein ABZ639_25015 [Saccharomonospora sp. NPDC006951]